jgi:hypothetical protein
MWASLEITVYRWPPCMEAPACQVLVTKRPLARFCLAGGSAEGVTASSVRFVGAWSEGWYGQGGSWAF